MTPSSASQLSRTFIQDTKMQIWELTCHQMRDRVNARFMQSAKASVVAHVALPLKSVRDTTRSETRETPFDIPPT